jgi:hypothetical protein
MENDKYLQILAEDIFEKIEKLSITKHYIKCKKKEIKNLKKKFIYHYEKKYGKGSYKKEL